MKRVLKPSGSIWVNLGDKYAGSGGHNNSNIGAKAARGPSSYSKSAAVGRRIDKTEQRYVKGDVPKKSLMGLPWRYAIGCIDDLGLILRAEIIWDKPNGLPESVNDRVRRSHEQWFMFTKQGKYFAAVDEVREPHTTAHIQQQISPQRDMDRKTLGKQGLHDFVNPLGKLPGSVWTIPSEPLIIPEAVQEKYDLPDHFAAFPQEWPRRIILGWSPNGICVKCGEGRRPVSNVEYHDAAGGSTATHTRAQAQQANALGVNRYPRGETSTTIRGYACLCHCTHCVSPNCPTEYHDATWQAPPTRPAVILDPFGGTGTVAGVARALGRFGISVDLSSDYCRLAEWRIFKSGHFMKTIDRTRGERLLSLFDEETE